MSVVMGIGNFGRIGRPYMTQPEGEAQRRAREAKQREALKTSGRGDQPASQETVDDLVTQENPDQTTQQNEQTQQGQHAQNR